MITNPGGQLSPGEILGRNVLISRIWRTLDGRCVYMNDLRRIGKTQIMVKMEAEPLNGWVCKKRDLGGAHTASEFATQVYKDSADVLTGGRKALRHMSDLLEAAAGTEIAGVIKLPDGSTAPWKEVLRRTFNDIHENMQKSNQRMLFLWDEVPFLLDNIAKREGPNVAMEVLDVLRSLTQDYDRVRLLLTGSIGLHHILKSLHEKGYSGSPLNRMELIKPGPLDHQPAVDLAKALLVGEHLTCDNLDQCATSVAESVGNVPFYIHKLVSRLPMGHEVTQTLIEETLAAEISSVENDWDLEHYRNRINDYYPGDDSKPVLNVLDCVAVHGPLDFESIRSIVAAQMDVDAESLRKLIALLCRDHYLHKTATGRYGFYLEVVRRWWQVSRDLPGVQG